MKFTFWKKKKPAKSQSITQEWLGSIVFAIVAATLIRWTTVEAFVVPTPSMENTILVGDYLFVSKFHYGTRTTTTPLQIPLTHQKIWGTNIPSYLDWVTLPSYRLPGISEIKRGDVVVFNVPPISLNKGIAYPVQLKTNYVKRCVGIAGDRIEVRNRMVTVNGTKQAWPANGKFRYSVVSREEITQRNLHAMELDGDDYTLLGRVTGNRVVYRMLLTLEQLSALQKASYVVSITDDFTTHDGPEDNIFPVSRYSRWNGDNYGPVIIPKKGMKIHVNDSTMAFYGETIELYEPGHHLSLADGKLTDDGKTLMEYTFQQDYFFMMGDNRHNSLDSRYWGFVPKDHIVGKALFIWLSMDYDADLLHKIRWNRLFTKIE